MFISRSRLLLIALGAEAAVFLIALVLAYWFNVELRPLPQDLASEINTALLATVPPLLLFMATVSVYAKDFASVRSLRKTLLVDIRYLFSRTRFPDLLVISLAAGVAEEMLFRGVIQTRFGLLAASILFGLAHFVTPAYAVAATVMGLYIGLVFYLSDSLFVVVALHALYDLSALTYIRYLATEDR